MKIYTDLHSRRAAAQKHNQFVTERGHGAVVREWNVVRYADIDGLPLGNLDVGRLRAEQAKYAENIASGLAKDDDERRKARIRHVLLSRFRGTPMAKIEPNTRDALWPATIQAAIHGYQKPELERYASGGQPAIGDSITWSRPGTIDGVVMLLVMELGSRHGRTGALMLGCEDAKGNRSWRDVRGGVLLASKGDMPRLARELGLDAGQAEPAAG